MTETLARDAAARPPIPPPIRPIVFDTVDDMAGHAAARIASVLDDAIERRGRASIALSGGSTPEPVYDRLGLCLLPWRRILATLVDERWVPPSSPDSNARMVARSLLAGPAQACRFLPFWRPGVAPETTAADLDRQVFQPLGRLDVVVLGMGGDGHTASLFPHAPELAAGLDPGGAERCIAIEPGSPAPSSARLTLTARALLDARLIVLVIAGAAKRDALERALRPGPSTAMPVRAILRQTRAPLEIYWAP